MKAILATLSSVLFCSLLFAPHALASGGTYQLSCEPAGSGATATLEVVIEVKQSSSGTPNGTAMMNVSLQNTGGSAPLTQKDVEVSGQVENAVDSNGNQPYQVLFGQPALANLGITYARIAIGDDDVAGEPNSYIRDSIGVYYYARCQSPGR